jgi:hypothetical protein
MLKSKATLLLPLATAAALGGALPAQDPVVERLDRIEAENRDLRQALEELRGRSAAQEEDFEALGSAFEQLQLGDMIPAIGESRYGLGPAASKVYGIEQGLSVGGYGEFLYENRDGGVDRLDALRAVLYFGYKFDEHWVLNTEIEIEHATTSSSSGTTSSGGSVSLEFGYLDYLQSEAFNVRAGVVLVPMGLINELHEPITFLGAQRPEVERRILPTTWRAPGVGVFGDVGGFSYRAYLVTALNGEEFDDGGFRDARQKGNRTAADDFALTARLDWTDTPGLLVGASVYWGDTGQDGVDPDGNFVPDLTTAIVDLHFDWKPGPLWLRGLWAGAWVDDTGDFFASTGTSVARRLDGFYVEAGFDVLAGFAPDSGQALYPFVRYEEVDTQAAMASGVPRQPGRDETIWTVGLHWRPIPQVVVKADYQDAESGQDRFDLLLGYVF